MTEAERDAQRAIERDCLFGLNDPPWQIINRATWCRGERQRIALGHLKQRGLFLDKEHRLRAGGQPDAA
jgi:hypothetical protein